MSEWTTNEQITSSKLNQKGIYVGSSAPSTPYDGELWWDTTSGTKILKLYDSTTSTWRKVSVYELFDDDTQVSVTGTTETEKKTARFPISTWSNLKNIHVIAGVWSNNASYTTSLLVYRNSEGSASLTLTSTSLTEELKEGDFTVNDLSSGIHTLKFKLKSNNASGTAYHKFLMVYAWG